MSFRSVGPPPTARLWRARFRRARRRHHERSLGDLFTDLYTLLWLVLVYGVPLASVVRRHAGLVDLEPPTEALWITAGLVVVGVGMVWRGLGALGPLLASPAEQSWAVATPVDRRGWLLPRLTFLLFFAAVAFAAVAGGICLMLHAGDLGWTTLSGGVLGFSVAGGSVFVQGRLRDDRWIRWPGAALVGVGVLVAATAVGAHVWGLSLPSLGMPHPFTLAMAGVPMAAMAVVAAVRTLPAIDLAALGAGAQLAEATVTATLGMDPSVLSGILEVRHWRRVGRVHSRPFRYGRLGRTWVLIQAECRRQLRRPAALGSWLALVVAQYAVALLAPSLAGVARLILVYVATNRLAAGLRVLSRSPGLRRSLGGEDVGVRLAHLVIPALGAGMWWLATGPTGGRVAGPLDLILVAGVSAAAYRSATRPPLSYGGVVMETPFGLLPLEMVVQMARGPDLLGALIILQWIAGG